MAVLEGGCRCGKLRFRVSGDEMMYGVCHCTGCQRMSGSAFSLTSTYPAECFELLAGEPVIGGLHGEARHHHCSFCLSWVFTRAEAMGDIVNVRTSMLDDVPERTPFVESFTSEALPWAVVGARFAFERFPPAERFPELISGYADMLRTERGG